MNLAKLSKEQTQYIVLGVVVGVIGIGLLYFGIRTSMSSLSVAKNELNELSRKIEMSDRTLAKRSRTSLDYEASIETLSTHVAHIPPKRNYYSWATEIIYAAARLTELEVDAIDEDGAPAKVTKTSGEIQFESYALRITAHGGYEQVKHFLRELQFQQPLIRFGGIEINRGAQPEIHDLQFRVEWPFNLSEQATAWQGTEKRKPVTTPPLEPVVPEALPVVAVAPEPVVEPVVETPPPAIEPPVAETVTAPSNGTSADKLESLLENQSQKSEASWNAFIGTLQGVSE